MYWCIYIHICVVYTTIAQTKVLARFINGATDAQDEHTAKFLGRFVGRVLGFTRCAVTLEVACIEKTMGTTGCLLYFVLGFVNNTDVYFFILNKFSESEFY